MIAGQGLPETKGSVCMTAVLGWPVTQVMIKIAE